MKKALRTISVLSGIISIISAILLVCAYLEDLSKLIERIKRLFSFKLFRKD